MALQTYNLLLLIRCFTKYIIEIENESALLEQLNVKPPKVVTDGKILNAFPFFAYLSFQLWFNLKKLKMKSNQAWSLQVPKPLIT